MDDDYSSSPSILMLVSIVPRTRGRLLMCRYQAPDNYEPALQQWRLPYSTISLPAQSRLWYFFHQKP